MEMSTFKSSKCPTLELEATFKKRCREATLCEIWGQISYMGHLIMWFTCTQLHMLCGAHFHRIHALLK